MSGGNYHQPSAELHSLRTGKPVSDFTLDDWLAVGRLSVDTPDYPPFLLFFSQRIGKRISAFTKDDWRRAAEMGGSLIEELTDIAYPTPKKRGAPKKHDNAYAKLIEQMEKMPRGRPEKLWYGKYEASQIADFVASTRRISLRSSKDAPKTMRHYLRLLMRDWREKTGIPEDLGNLETAIRRSKKKTQMRD